MLLIILFICLLVIIQYEQHLRGTDHKDGNEGHPNCEFCHKRFYDKYGLFMHLQKDHFQCHLCEKRGILYQYFSDYGALHHHFKFSHFACEDPQCVEQKYIVFGDEFSLIAHHNQHHQHPQSRKSLVYPHHNRDRDRDRDRRAQDQRHVRFDAGLGGKATRDGMWQILLEEAALSRDPRAAAREREHGDPRRGNDDRGLDADRGRGDFPTAPSPPAAEDFPGLPPSSVSGSASGSARGFGFGPSGGSTGMRRGGSVDDFPTLGGGPAPLVGSVVSGSNGSAAAAVGRSASAGLMQSQAQEPTMLFGKAVKKSKKLFVYKPEKGSKSSGSSSSSSSSSSGAGGAASITSFMGAVTPPMSLAVALHNGLPPPLPTDMATPAAATSSSKEERKAMLAKLMNNSAAAAAIPGQPAPTEAQTVAEPAKEKTAKAKAKAKAPVKSSGPSIVDSIMTSKPATTSAAAVASGGGISILRVKSPGISPSSASACASSGMVSLVPAPRYEGQKDGDFPDLPVSSTAAAPAGYRVATTKATPISPAATATATAAGSPSGRQQQQQWKCTVCTLINAVGRNSCLACESPRMSYGGAKPTKPAPAPAPAANANSGNSMAASIDFDMDFPPPPPSVVSRPNNAPKSTDANAKGKAVSINNQSKRIISSRVGIGAGGVIAGTFAGGSINSKPGGNPKPNKWEKPPV